MFHVQVDMLSAQMQIIRECIDDCECRLLAFDLEGGDSLRIRFSDLAGIDEFYTKLGIMLGKKNNG